MAVAAPMIGNIQEYRQENELFSSYIERVELFFVANSIANDKKVAAFLSVIGSKSYSLLRSLVAPAKPKEKSYKDLVAALKKHFEPTPIVIAERFHFHRRAQAVGETISEYMAELRRLTTHCQFGAYLDEALRDRLVCGLRNEGIQKKLLTEADLTLARALELSLGMEAAEKNARSLKVSEPAVNRIAAKPCYRCGKTSHDQKDCRFREADCHNCGKKGHIAAVCRSPKQNVAAKTRPPRQRRGNDRKRHSTKFITTEEHDTESLSLHSIGGGATPPIKVPLIINNNLLNMELDTGATITIMSERQFREIFPGAKMEKSNVLLKTYTGESLPVVGEVVVQVQHNQQSRDLALTIVGGDGPSLLGRDWLKHLKLNWKAVHSLREHAIESLDDLLERYSELFTEELGTIKSFCAKLNVDPEACPKFFKARTVPYALKSAIEDELDRLEGEGIVEKVTHSEWATPIVAVPKPDGRVRLCGDFKVTVNQSLSIEQYPLPKVEDLFATLAGGKKFTKLDLTQAYLQFELEPESQKYCTINTHRGLYQFKRLPFGIASAPALFQKVMDTILQGAPGAMCYIDDILVTGTTQTEHLKNLEEVFRRLQSHGIRMKRNKCLFMQESVEYLGHRLDADGIRATPEKVAAIMRAPMPKNVQQLRSFLGLLNYYRKFLPNLATIVQPLNDLLQKNRKWLWTTKCTQAVKTAKELLTTSNLLMHYDPSLPLKLAADASQYGLGAVISHVLQNGEERPIAFASRSLTASEKNYSQIDKEALSLIYGIQKFHSYLYGRRFTLVTDHKPLTSILGPKKGVPSVAAARMQRWALLLAAYNYDIEFRPTTTHCNADALSRLPLPDDCQQRPSETSMYHVRQIEALPITSQAIRTATQRDPTLSKVKTHILKGWPENIPKEIQVYHNKKAELSVEQGCLLWGGRVIIPQSLQQKILSDLHREHLGISKMKALARSHVWWTGLDHDLEVLVKNCPACAEVKQAPPKAPLHPWTWPSRPWQRIHVDFAGPFMKKMFLIVVDAYSKWGEVIEMNQTTAAETIMALRQLFANHGIPEQIVSDNGPQFISSDFAAFLKMNGVQHTRSSPYHPATNGEAERFVRTFKEAMKTSRGDGLTLPHRINNFLLTYRTTPHMTTRTPPCELLMGRSLRTRWDLLKPGTDETVRRRQANQKAQHNQHARLRCLSIGASVMVRNFSSGPDWVPGVVARRLGPLTYLIDVFDGRLWKRHVDHVKEFGHVRHQPEVHSETEFDVDPPAVSLPSSDDPIVLDIPDVSEARQNESGTDAVSSESTTTSNDAENGTPETVETTPNLEPRSENETTNSSNVEPTTCGTPTPLPGLPARLYPSRSRKPPDRFGH